MIARASASIIGVKVYTASLFSRKRDSGALPGDLERFNEVLRQRVIRLAVVFFQLARVAEHGDLRVNRQLRQQRRARHYHKISPVAWPENLVARAIGHRQ